MSIRAWMLCTFSAESVTWGAVDIDNEKVMAVWVSYGRSSLEAAAFLKKVRAACDGRLPRVFVDGGIGSK